MSEAAGRRARLLVALLLVEAVVTAVLNVDTAVVFMTPVLLHAAAVFTANSASLVFPAPTRRI